MKTLHDNAVVDDALQHPPKPAILPDRDGAGPRRRRQPPRNRVAATHARGVAGILVGGTVGDGAARRLLRGPLDLPRAGAPRRGARTVYDSGSSSPPATRRASMCRRTHRIHAAPAVRARARRCSGPARPRDLSPGVRRAGEPDGAAGTALTGDGTPGSARSVLRARRGASGSRRCARRGSTRPSTRTGTCRSTSRAPRSSCRGRSPTSPKAAAEALAVTPGIYAVSVETLRRQQTKTGVTRTTVSESNQMAFSLAARIVSVARQCRAGFDLNVGMAADLEDGEPEVQLAIDGLLYEEIAAFPGAAGDDAGRFRQTQAQARIRSSVRRNKAGRASHPLVVNGAESQPFWVDHLVTGAGARAVERRRADRVRARGRLARRIAWLSGCDGRRSGRSAKGPGPRHEPPAKRWRPKAARGEEGTGVDAARRTVRAFMCRGRAARACHRRGRRARARSGCRRAPSKRRDRLLPTEALVKRIAVLPPAPIWRPAGPLAVWGLVGRAADGAGRAMRFRGRSAHRRLDVRRGLARPAARARHPRPAENGPLPPEWPVAETAARLGRRWRQGGEPRLVVEGRAGAGRCRFGCGGGADTEAAGADRRSGPDRRGGLGEIPSCAFSASRSTPTRR